MADLATGDFGIAVAERRGEALFLGYRRRSPAVGFRAAFDIDRVDRQTRQFVGDTRGRLPVRTLRRERFVSPPAEFGQRVTERTSGPELSSPETVVPRKLRTEQARPGRCSL